jgi:hypothetical protein
MTYGDRLNSDQPLGNLTVADLEILMAAILPRLLKPYLAFSNAVGVDATQPPASVLETFGSWEEDDQLTETIISNIYASRTLASADHTP